MNVSDYLADLRRGSHLSDERWEYWCTAVTEAYENPPGFVSGFESSVRAQMAAEWLAELRPVFESAARADQPLVEYHGRRLGIELLPLHGREVK